jgi:hypothetical protein
MSENEAVEAAPVVEQALGGLAWGERVGALGPDNAITASGRIFAR